MRLIWAVGGENLGQFAKPPRPGVSVCGGGDRKRAEYAGQSIGLGQERDVVAVQLGAVHAPFGQDPLKVGVDGQVVGTDNVG